MALMLLHGSVATSHALPFVTVFEHSGSIDPGTEGWSGSGGGPVVNDAGSGFDAWISDDNSSTGPDGAGYFQVPTDAQIAQGNAFGWRLSGRIRVVDASDTPGGSPALLYRDGSRTWQIHFGSEADGDPIVNLITGVSGSGTTTGLTSFILEGGGSGYHLYELAFDPVLGSADLFIDGTELVSDYVGAGFGGGFPLPKSVFWGAASTGDTGQGNYNLVRFEIDVPEPSAALLLATGLVGLCVRRRRRH